MADGITAFVLVEVKPRSARSVQRALENLGDSNDGVKVTRSASTAGPFDGVAVLEGPDQDAIGRYINNHIQQIEGVKRTTTLVEINLGD
jgi:DNA-binding Lrp family transcriptional regulator